MAVDPFGGKPADTSDAADDFLGGGNYTSMVAVKFPKVGAQFDGTLLSWGDPVQRTDINTGELMWFEGRKHVKDSEVKNERSARPSLQVLMDFQIPEGSEHWGITWKGRENEEEAVPDDDGTRRAYVFGAMLDAIVEARKEAAVKLGQPEGSLAPLEKGIRLQMKRGKSKKYSSGFNGHTFVAKWTPAADNPNYKPEADSFLGGEDPFNKDEGDEPPF
jgi:hypothetical protein